MLIAPRRQSQDFIVSSGFGSRNLLDVCDAKPSQLPNLRCGFVHVGESSADKLKIFSTGRIGENRNLRCYAAMHEICRLQCPGAKGASRDDNDVGR